MEEYRVVFSLSKANKDTFMKMCFKSRFKGSDHSIAKSLGEKYASSK